MCLYPAGLRPRFFHINTTSVCSVQPCQHPEAPSQARLYACGQHTKTWRRRTGDTIDTLQDGAKFPVASGTLSLITHVTEYMVYSAIEYVKLFELFIRVLIPRHPACSVPYPCFCFCFKGSDPNESRPDGTVALHMSAQSGHTEVGWCLVWVTTHSLRQRTTTHLCMYIVMYVHVNACKVLITFQDMFQYCKDAYARVMYVRSMHVVA